MVGLERFNDLYDYTVEPLMPDRPKVKFQTKRDTGVYAVRGWSIIRRDCASEPETT